MPAEASKTPRTGVHRQPKKLVTTKDSQPAVVVQKKVTNKIVNKVALPGNKNKVLIKK